MRQGSSLLGSVWRRKHRRRQQQLGQTNAWYTAYACQCLWPALSLCSCLYDPVTASWITENPLRLGRSGCPFQFGRTSMGRPRAPHLAHTTLLANHGTSTSSGYLETSLDLRNGMPGWGSATAARRDVMGGPDGFLGAIASLLSTKEKPSAGLG